MASKAEKKKKARNRKGRITIDLTPEQIRERREKCEIEQAERESRKRAEGKRVDKWGINPSQVGGGAAAIDRDGKVTALTAPLASFSGIEVKRDESGKPRSAWKSNPFEVLRVKGVIDHDLANTGHDLMDIYAKSKGLDGGPALKVYDQVDGNLSDGWGIEDRKRLFANLYADILSELTPVSAQLAHAFAVAIVEEDRPMAWQGIVQRVTGHTNPQRQSSRMVQLCEELFARIPQVKRAYGV